MKILAKFNQTIGFTPAERRVIVILLAAFLAGIAIKIVKSVLSGPREYDYSSMDSAFAAMSGVIDIPDHGYGDSSKPGAPHDQTAVDSVIDINTATKSQLTGLPGIGEVLAERIIAYRQNHGRIDSVRELMYVEGIGEKKLKRISSLVKIGAHNE